MAHAETTNFPILRTTSNSDGTPIQDVLDSIEGKPFGLQSTVSQDGLCICIDDHLGLSNWGGYVSLIPKLNEFKFNGSDRPSYLPPATHNLSFDDALAIIHTKGESGTAYSAPDLET